MKNHRDLYTTFKYRGMRVDIYDDDYGQCYDYEIFDINNNMIKCGSCGTYNFDYESEPKFMIDQMIDVIMQIDRPHGIIKYANIEHTIITLQHRDRIIKTYTITPVHDVENIIQIAITDLKMYCSTPEFLQAEKERINKGQLYFDEINQ